ncbi:MAG: 4Fe-4S single cluster domain-containing protein [Candidatus Nanopelagicales bacterium]
MHHPVTALGPGRRVGLWVQGCALGCHGCMARDTWDPAAGSALPVAELLRRLDSTFGADSTLTGLTISGGEPLEQPEAVRSILAWLRERRPEVDSLLYTGWSQGRVGRDELWVMQAADALVPEPFVAGRAPGGRWRGSANQPLLLLSDLARERHSTAEGGSPALQISVTGGQLSLIGIPRPGDLDRMVDLARARGLSVRDLSWSD